MHSMSACMTYNRPVGLLGCLGMIFSRSGNISAIIPSVFSATLVSSRRLGLEDFILLCTSQAQPQLGIRF